MVFCPSRTFKGRKSQVMLYLQRHLRSHIGFAEERLILLLQTLACIA